MLLLITVLALFTSFAAGAEETQLRSLTTGLPTTREYKAIAVQLDNSIEARPQVNMIQADVIYEIEVDNGGYTRYTAIFNDTVPELIEAVRSARIVNVDIALDWNASFVHFGGQKLAGTNVYDYMKNVGITRFDGMTDTTNFYRDNTRIAPYNVVARLGKLHRKTSLPDSETLTTPLKFSEDTPTVKGEDVSVFRIPYSINNGYYPSYEYVPEEDVYYRYYNRMEFLDGAAGEHFTCDNVIVMYVDYTWYEKAVDRPIVALTGTNRCEYFIGGKHFTGTWSRASISDSTTYLDDEGKEVLLKPGKTFIQVVKPSVEIEYVR